MVSKRKVFAFAFLCIFMCGMLFPLSMAQIPMENNDEIWYLDPDYEENVFYYHIEEKIYDNGDILVEQRDRYLGIELSQVGTFLGSSSLIFNFLTYNYETRNFEKNTNQAFHIYYASPNIYDLYFSGEFESYIDHFYFPFIVPVLDDLSLDLDFLSTVITSPSGSGYTEGLNEIYSLSEIVSVDDNSLYLADTSGGSFNLTFTDQGHLESSSMNVTYNDLNLLSNLTAITEFDFNRLDFSYPAERELQYDVYINHEHDNKVKFDSWSFLEYHDPFVAYINLTARLQFWNEQFEHWADGFDGFTTASSTKFESNYIYDNYEMVRFPIIYPEEFTIESLNESFYESEVNKGIYEESQFNAHSINFSNSQGDFAYIELKETENIVQNYTWYLSSIGMHFSLLLNETLVSNKNEIFCYDLEHSYDGEDLHPMTLGFEISDFQTYGADLYQKMTLQKVYYNSSSTNLESNTNINYTYDFTPNYFTYDYNIQDANEMVLPILFLPRQNQKSLDIELLIPLFNTSSSFYYTELGLTNISYSSLSLNLTDITGDYYCNMTFNPNGQLIHAIVNVEYDNVLISQNVSKNLQEPNIALDHLKNTEWFVDIGDSLLYEIKVLNQHIRYDQFTIVDKQLNTTSEINEHIYIHELYANRTVYHTINETWVDEMTFLMSRGYDHGIFEGDLEYYGIFVLNLLYPIGTNLSIIMQDYFRILPGITGISYTNTSFYINHPNFQCFGTYNNNTGLIEQIEYHIEGEGMSISLNLIDSIKPEYTPMFNVPEQSYIPYHLRRGFPVNFACYFVSEINHNTLFEYQSFLNAYPVNISTISGSFHIWNESISKWTPPMMDMFGFQGGYLSAYYKNQSFRMMAAQVPVQVIVDQNNIYEHLVFMKHFFETSMGLEGIILTNYTLSWKMGDFRLYLEYTPQGILHHVDIHNPEMSFEFIRVGPRALPGNHFPTARIYHRYLENSQDAISFMAAIESFAGVEYIEWQINGVQYKNNSRTFSHIFEKNGTYQVSLIVIDANWNRIQIDKEIEILITPEKELPDRLETNIHLEILLWIFVTLSLGGIGIFIIYLLEQNKFIKTNIFTRKNPLCSETQIWDGEQCVPKK